MKQGGLTALTRMRGTSEYAICCVMLCNGSWARKAHSYLRCFILGLELGLDMLNLLRSLRVSAVVAMVNVV